MNSKISRGSPQDGVKLEIKLEPNDENEAILADIQTPMSSDLYLERLQEKIETFDEANVSCYHSDNSKLKEGLALHNGA